MQGPEDTGTSSEALVYTPAAGVPAGQYQVQVCQTPNTNGVPQMAPFDYNGIFTTDDSPTLWPELRHRRSGQFRRRI